MQNEYIREEKIIDKTELEKERELIKTIFNIFFIGTINILPNIKIKHIHAKYVITFVSIFSTPKKMIII